MAIELFSPSCVGAGKWIFQATKELASSALTQRLLSSLDLGSRLHVFAFVSSVSSFMLLLSFCIYFLNKIILPALSLYCQ